MNSFKGTIIEESLEDRSLLDGVKIVSTRISEVNEKHKTPWLKRWTLHKVEISSDQAENIAQQISKSLDRDHKNSWYADFKNESTHYVVYRDKIFKIDRTKKDEYLGARAYGLALGIPPYQIDFEKNTKKKRNNIVRDIFAVY